MGQGSRLILRPTVRRIREALPLLPFLAVVAVFLIIPTGTVLVNAVVVDGHFSLARIGGRCSPRRRWRHWAAAWCCPAAPR